MVRPAGLALVASAERSPGSSLQPRGAPAARAGAHRDADPAIGADLTLAAQIEASAKHPDLAERLLLRQGDRAWTCRRCRNEAVRYAHFLRGRLGRIDDARLGHVAMLLDNHLELLALCGGCAYAGFTLLGINTGLVGDTLARVSSQSRARLLVVD